MNAITAIPLDAMTLDTATRTVDGEAGSEPLEGKVAIAWVMRNRLGFAHPWWGTTIGDVCRKSGQFDCWMVTLGGKPNLDFLRITALDPAGAEYQAARQVVQSVMAGDIPDPCNGSTTYKVRGTPAEWDDAVEGVTPISIGKHDFWRLSPDGHCLPFLTDGIGGTDGGTNTAA